MTYMHEFPPETHSGRSIGHPITGIDLPITWIEGLYGQDFGLRLRPDALTMQREIRARRQRSAETARWLKAALGRVVDAVGAAATAYRRWNARLAIEAMSDHRLRDIGLRRDQIAGLFDGHAETPAPAGVADEAVVVPFSGSTGRRFATLGDAPKRPPRTPGTPLAA